MLYSFADLQTVVSHPQYGSYTASGTGIGTISLSMATDRSVQQVAADGTVMTSKVEGENGTATIAILQTSNFQKWLLGLYNYLKTADPSQWNQISVTMDATVMGDNNQMTNCSLQKRADRPYQAQGQLATWTILAESVAES